MINHMVKMCTKELWKEEGAHRFLKEKEKPSRVRYSSQNLATLVLILVLPEIRLRVQLFDSLRTKWYEKSPLTYVGRS